MAYLLCNIHEYLIRSEADKAAALKEGKKLGDAVSQCSIPDCCKPRYASGYCCAHYTRLLRHGDPLGGGTPRGGLLRWIHEVAIHHSGDDCLIWAFSKTQQGYGKVAVDGKMVVVSRYVCELVHGAPPTPEHEAAHSCGRGRDGCISQDHLSWKTRTENQADRIDHGTSNRGERHGHAKLTEDAVREIFALQGVEPKSKLAERFMVAKQTISDIQTGRTWAWLFEEGEAA